MEHPSDPTGLRRVHRKDAKNLLFTILFHAVYLGEGELTRRRESGAACCAAAEEPLCCSVAAGDFESHSRRSLVGGDWSEDLSSEDLVGGLRRRSFVRGETGGPRRKCLQFLE